MSLSLGQAKGYINTIEAGKSLPSLKMFLCICEYFKIEPRDFFDTGTEYPMLTLELLDVSQKLDEKSLQTVLSIAKGLKK